MIVAYTSLYGRYDDLPPVPSHPLVDEWIAYTDDPALSASGWRTVVEPRPGHPRLAAKWRKCHPPEATASIWLDASVHLVSPALIDVILGLLDGADMAFFPHPDRVDIVDEVSASHREQGPKYEGLDLAGQVARYEGRTRTRLYASTVFGRVHGPRVLAMGGAWWAHNDLLTYQDQLSLPVVLAQYQIRVADIPGGLRTNPWFRLRPHKRPD